MIVHRQEELAIRLLDRALDKKEAPGSVAVPKNEPPIDVQLDVFAKVGQWVAVKNKLTEMEDTQLDEFKRRIHADYKGEALSASGSGCTSPDDARSYRAVGKVLAITTRRPRAPFRRSAPSGAIGKTRAIADRGSNAR